MLNKVQYLLTILQEELAETTQRASKIIRFGQDDVQKDHTETNAERLVYEFNDVLAIMELLQQEGVIELIQDRTAIEKKKLKIKKYMKYSQQLGVLEEPTTFLEAQDGGPLEGLFKQFAQILSPIEIDPIESKKVWEQVDEKCDACKAIDELTELEEKHFGKSMDWNEFQKILEDGATIEISFREPKLVEVGPEGEKSIQTFDTLEKIVEQLEHCEYQCKGGPLNNNTAFIALKRLSENGGD